MMVRFLLLIILAAQMAFGQLRQVPTGPDLEYLYSRVSDSAYVIKGRAVARKGVVPRRPAIQVDPSTGTFHGSGSISDFGTLFTVSVEEVVCRQGDFRPALAREDTEDPLPGSLMYFFVPRNEPPAVPSRLNPYQMTLREDLMPGREYLLFVRNVPKQEELLSKYILEPGLTYYRTYERDRGVIALPDAAHPEWKYAFTTPTVSAVTAFCSAAKAPDADTKIRNLNALRESAHPALRPSIDAAIMGLRRTPVDPSLKP